MIILSIQFLDVLRKAEQKIGDMPSVDAVLLNGGMTKFHTIQKRLETLFGLPPIAAGDPDKAVARGAVVYHYDLHRGIKPARIVNDTIGLEIDGGKIKPLVEAGTILPLPQPKPIPNLTASEGALFLRLPFYLGSRKDTQPPNRPILERTVRFQRQLLKGEPVFIQVQVDERGIMSVEGWPEADPDQKITVSIDSNQPAAANETSNGMSRHRANLTDQSPDSHTDDTREEGQSAPGAEQLFVPSGISSGICITRQYLGGAP